MSISAPPFKSSASFELLPRNTLNFSAWWLWLFVATTSRIVELGTSLRQCRKAAWIWGMNSNGIHSPVPSYTDSAKGFISQVLLSTLAGFERCWMKKTPLLIPHMQTLLLTLLLCCGIWLATAALEGQEAWQGVLVNKVGAWAEAVHAA